MIDFLTYAASRYYNGSPILSDDEFDKLAAEHSYEHVGARVTNGIPHAFPMYSLDKCYVDEELKKLPGQQTITPKLDGAAVSLLYFNGKFVRGLTRGDGIKGQDITNNIRWIVPNRVAGNGIRQIIGEVVADKSIENARNYAAGALSLSSDKEFISRNLTFVAYGVQPYYCDIFQEDMETLKDYGFDTVVTSNLDKFPTDGKVYRVNDNDLFDELGYTRKHPRGAFALKENQEGIVTQLLEVIWQVGRTGVVSPVGILAPVKIGGAMVSRATLHNLKYISGLGLEIGCDVELIRAGEIIPRIVRRV